MTPIFDTRPILLRVLKGIEDARPLASENRREVWDRCWQAKSEPDYFTSTVRFYRSYFEAPGFERAEFTKLRASVFEKWLSSAVAICEFGCGAGSNLTAKIPQRGQRVIGYDWSEAALKRCAERGIEAHSFNMLEPDATNVPLGAAALTIHSMEQLGENWARFLGFLRAVKPSVVVHIEPIAELYDRNDLLDYLALQYHSKRGYLTGYYQQLARLDADNEIELLDVRRSYFGSLFHDAYSVVVWRPLS